MPNWQELALEDVFANLQTVKGGLTDEEAAYRLQKFGPNELKEEKKISALHIFLSQFTNFLVIILILATIFSALVGEIIDAEAILIIVVLNAVFGFFQEYKAERSMEALKKLANPESIVLRSGQKKKVLSSTLVPGDIIVLEQGDKIPADIRLTEVIDFKVDEASLTGESASVKKTTSPCSTTTLADMKCMSFMGTIATYGRATGIVVRTGMETEMGKIAHIVQTEGEPQTPLQKSLDKFGKQLGFLIMAICAIVVLTGMMRGGELIHTIIIGVALAVAAIPEGLPAVVTVTLAIGMQHMAKNKAIIRKLHAVETLGSVSIICSDKTGTLTKNEMTVRKIWMNSKMIDVMGTGYEPTGEFLLDGNKIDKNDQLELMLRAASLCTNSQVKKDDISWSIIGDPTEGALNVAAEKFGMKKELLEQQNPRTGEIPFTSERKMMSTYNKYGNGAILCVKGAPEIVLEKCSKFQFGSKIIDMNQNLKDSINDAINTMTGNALRVLAIACKQNDNTEEGLTFLGLMGMIDPPRAEVREDIIICSEAGIKVVMITGDNINTAIAIAKDLGISGRAVTGDQLEGMKDSELNSIVEDVAVYARVNPIHKARIVDALKLKNHIIAMTGDGINDAPALKKADIGVAMGIKGTDVAKEASDMVLEDDNFSTIVAAVRDGRMVYNNIKNFILYLLSSNMAEVMIVFSAMLIGFTDNAGIVVIPLTALQLLWINLVTDGLPAVALGTDGPVNNVMKRKPRDPREKILSRKMFTEIVMVGTVVTIITMALFVYYISDHNRAMTVAFTALVLLELLNIFRIRAEAGHRLFSNRKLMYAVAVSVFLQLIVVYVPVLDPIFETVELNAVDWGMISLGMIAFAMFSFIRVRLIKQREQVIPGADIREKKKKI